ncbi:MAG: NAD/NADP octopine/nopaline dehydrogenase family protein [Prevotellaceae bacterium]|nr:NAD/NADP octopine/nopaline dehydrogenase family protein [Candidatus Faecinaster equi]
MKITVIGGGNIGTLMAAEFAHRGNSVSLYTSDPSKWSNDITVNDELGNELYIAHLDCISNSYVEVIPGAEYIFVAMPSFLYDGLSKKIVPLIEKGQKIGFVPGSGGAEFSFMNALDKGAILFGLQRVHSISRLESYGHSVNMLGRKSELQVASIPRVYSSEISNDLERLFEIPCVSLSNYLTVTLTPSNPILHTTRLYSMFKDMNKYDHNVLFYEEWTNASSEMLFACDAELQSVIKSIPELDLSNVISLPFYYESDTPERLTNKIKSIQAFKGITSPMLEVNGVWVPDYNSRYFTEDFPYGLQIIKQMAAFCNVDCPNIDKVLAWYKTIKANDKQFDFYNYGITNLTQVVEYNCK